MSFFVPPKVFWCISIRNQSDKNTFLVGFSFKSFATERNVFLRKHYLFIGSTVDFHTDLQKTKGESIKRKALTQRNRCFWCFLLNFHQNYYHRPPRKYSNLCDAHQAASSKKNCIVYPNHSKHPQVTQTLQKMVSEIDSRSFM